jgi:hypothetical protein
VPCHLHLRRHHPIGTLVAMPRATHSKACQKPQDMARELRIKIVSCLAIIRMRHTMRHQICLGKGPTHPIVRIVQAARILKPRGHHLHAHQARPVAI